MNSTTPILSENRGIHRGIPSFFRACCYKAAHASVHSYADAGWHLTNSLGSEVPYDLNLDEWAIEVEKLEALIVDGDDEAVWGWFLHHYPKCMTLVPARRREQFVKGVRSAHEDGRLCL